MPLCLHVVKGDLVGPGGWSVMNYPATNSPMVGGAPGYGFHPLAGSSRE